jgi:hypothetical protein
MEDLKSSATAKIQNVPSGIRNYFIEKRRVGISHPTPLITKKTLSRKIFVRI